MRNGNDPNILHGTVLEIQRMSTEDGPGIRTTVFFKGCNLRCIWCHNPESISPQPQVQWIGSRCIGCRTCLAVCPNGALSVNPDGISIDRNLCDGCGTCASECPSTAMDLLGKKWALDNLIAEVEKDRAYYEQSGGGITVSGGDPTMQADFVSTFLKGCKRKGLQTAMDTSGQCSKETLHMFLPHVDILLYDVKEIDPIRHKRFTGNSNERILENIIHVRDYMDRHGNPKGFWIRTPIIPDATARDENIMGIGNFIAKNLGHMVDRWELCSFNNLCRDKYTRLGVSWRFQNYALLTESFMEHITDVAKNSGVDPHIVHWTGSVRVMEDHKNNPNTRATPCI